MVALIDGEHYPPVVNEALEELTDAGEEIAALVFLGGTEKIMEKKHSEYDYPVVTAADPIKAIYQAIDCYAPQGILDLSDEPIVGYKERFRIASAVLARGIDYSGADFQFRSPDFYDVAEKPSLGIVGTGKRVGKTAVSAYACRELKKAGFNPGVVAMGRGGPPEPEVIRGDQIEIDADYLFDQAKKGRHAASDHFEDALMSRVPTVGCRRCGGGMAGQAFVSNVLAGADVMNGLDVDFAVFEGSGAAMPPIKTDTRLTVAGMNQPQEYVIGYLGPFRILTSDVVVLTNCEASVGAAAMDELIAGISSINPDVSVFKTVFRPEPLQDVSGRKVFFATTAPPSAGDVLRDFLESDKGAEVVGISHNLADRPKLRQDIETADDFDILLTELKAAAVDVATALGLEMRKQVIYCDNIPISVDGRSLAAGVVDLASKSVARFKERQNGKEARAN